MSSTPCVNACGPWIECGRRRNSNARWIFLPAYLPVLFLQDMRLSVGMFANEQWKRDVGSVIVGEEECWAVLAQEGENVL